MRKWHSIEVRVLISAVVLAALLALAAGIAHTPVKAQAGNLLQNPGFEPPFVALNGDSTLQVASNWQPWSLPQGSSSSINARPEYKPAPSNRVHSGSAAQEYNTFFATHTGGVYQRVPVTPNTQLRFSVFVYVWSSASFANPDVSDDPNDVKVRVGIDPTGGTDGTSANIVWSQESEFYDQYRELSVVATAQNTAVTVFVRSAPTGFIGTTNIYLDDAALLPLGSAPATATFAPTNTSVQPSATPDILEPTQEGTITPVPTSNRPTAIPTSVPLPGEFDTTITYTVVAGDTVSGLAQRYSSTVNAIVQVNKLSDAGLIYVGQTLLIPVHSGQNQPPTFTPPFIPTTNPATAVPSAVPTTVPGGGQNYTVQPGDTLYAIALRFNATIAVLAQINRIVNPNLIYPGQVLVVPGASVPTFPTQVPQQPPTPVPPVTPLTHVVQPGENLFRISLRYNVSLDALARANRIYNVNLIFAGQVLVIPR